MLFTMADVKLTVRISILSTLACGPLQHTSLSKKLLNQGGAHPEPSLIVLESDGLPYTLDIELQTVQGGFPGLELLITTPAGTKEWSNICNNQIG